MTHGRGAGERKPYFLHTSKKRTHNSEKLRASIVCTVGKINKASFPDSDKNEQKKKRSQFFKKSPEKRTFTAIFLSKDRHQRELFQSYLSELSLDCLELFICSNWTSEESLGEISMSEKHISIGWGCLSGSVAFLSSKRAKIAVFAYIFAFRAEFKRFSSKIH